MQTMKKPKVGQTLYSLNTGNAARNCEQKLTPVNVSRVGRKYFYCIQGDSARETKYKLEDWKESTNYCCDSVLYESRQEREDEEERTRLKDKAREYFGAFGARKPVTLEKLRKIVKILEGENE